MTYIPLDHRYLPMNRHLLSPELLIEVKVPHVSLVEGGEGLDVFLFLSILVFRVQNVLPTLGVRGQVEAIR
jgi:hypothetical protein